VARGRILLFIGALFVTGLFGQRGTIDPAFEKIPFDQWLGEHEKPRFRLGVSLSRAELSFHQRFESQLEIKLDGKDLQTKRGDGNLLFFVQVTDSNGTRYQDHGSIDLGKLEENVKAADLEYSQSAFFLPGDYKIATAILDTATGDHVARELPFKVSPPKQGFLVDAWRSLPAVEFIPHQQSPESWYLPEIQGKLQWAASVPEPARLHVIINASNARAGMAGLLPTLKAISETGSSPISENIELLDLARRRPVFHQDDVHDLDWPRLKQALAEANTASIDVHSLSERSHDAQFFVSQVRKLIRASEKPCVLVVLTNPVAFESGEDLTPISLAASPAACRVIYIRYHARSESYRPIGPQMAGRGRGSGMGPRMGGTMARNRTMHEPIDQLEPTLKPLSPKVFDVETPEEMTKALADIEHQMRYGAK
jgi:hypothetical protein